MATRKTTIHDYDDEGRVVREILIEETPEQTWIWPWVHAFGCACYLCKPLNPNPNIYPTIYPTTTTPYATYTTNRANAVSWLL